MPKLPLLPITKFDGPNYFLSNFYPSLVVYNGLSYMTVEHAYQAAKSLTTEGRERIRGAQTPGIAKRIGRKVPLRKDWEEVKIQIMRSLVRLKFVTHQNLRDLLVATGKRELVEGNYWRDYFWGVCDGRGENRLGKILMEVRKELADA